MQNVVHPVLASNSTSWITMFSGNTMMLCFSNSLDCGLKPFQAGDSSVHTVHSVKHRTYPRSKSTVRSYVALSVGIVSRGHWQR